MSGIRLLLLIPSLLAATPCRAGSPPSLTDLDAAIRRGVKFILSTQDRHGELASTVCDDRGSCGPDSTPFITALALSSLRDVDDPRLPPLRREATRFLQSEQLPGGLWRFFTLRSPSGHDLRPDLDDTAVISSVLLQERERFQDNRALIRRNVDSDGIFMTWMLVRGDTIMDQLLPASRLRLERGRRRNHPYAGYTEMLFRWKRYHEFPNEIDPVVNVNVLEYLREEPGPVCDFLNWAVRERIPSVYYLNDIHAHYFFARAYRRGVRCIAPSLPLVVNDLLTARQPDGGFGSAQKTALALNALLDLGHSGPAVDGAAARLLDLQQPDGRWQDEYLFKESAFCKECHYWKSPAMATAFAIEALRKFRVTSGKAKEP